MNCSKPSFKLRKSKATSYFSVFDYKLRKEIFKIKINHLVPPSEANVIANDAFNFFINKRHKFMALAKLRVSRDLNIVLYVSTCIYSDQLNKYV